MCHWHSQLKTQFHSQVCLFLSSLPQFTFLICHTFNKPIVPSVNSCRPYIHSLHIPFIPLLCYPPFPFTVRGQFLAWHFYLHGRRVFWMVYFVLLTYRIEVENACGTTSNQRCRGLSPERLTTKTHFIRVLRLKSR